MTITSWLHGLTRGSLATLKRPLASAPRRRDHRNWQSAECLEVRTLLSAYAPGFALGIGSTGIDRAFDVAADHSGNVFVAGNFNSASIDLDPGPGTYTLTNAGVFDGFAAKYDPAGNLLWGVQESGTGHGNVAKVAVDGAGNALIFGTFAGSIDIGAPTAGLAHVTLSNGGGNDWFLAKIDSAGNALWATDVGTLAARWVSAITADAAGNVYATGNEGNRLFVAKYSAEGASAWTQVVSGVTGKTYKVSGSGVAVDANSNVYVTGTYLGKIDFNPAANQTNWLTSSVGNDAFVLKLDANGTFVRARSIGGRGDDSGTGIALDSAGNVHVIGGFGLPSGVANVVKLDPNLNAIWGRNTLAVDSTGGTKIALDASGNVYTTGYFSGTVDADPGPGTFNLTAGGEYDAYIIQLNSAGNFVWAGALGGPGSGRTQSNAIAVDGLGNILTVGYFAGTGDFDPGLATYALTATPDGIANRYPDAFVLKLVPSTALQAASGTALHATAGAASLSAKQVTPLIPEALARSRAAGASTAGPGNRQVRITNLRGMKLDLASGNTITLDDDAAGWDWFVDPTAGSR